MQSVHQLLRWLAPLISLILIAAAGCHSRHADEPAVRRYEVKGRIESIDLNRQRVTINHEEIKGYMDAMTMSFAVKDERMLRELKSGDQVRATLVYDSSSNLSWLEEIKTAQK